MSRSSNEDVYVGKYKLMKTIGKGNFAKVKLAKHMPTGQEVRRNVCVHMCKCVICECECLLLCVCLLVCVCVGFIITFSLCHHAGSLHKSPLFLHLL